MKFTWLHMMIGWLLAIQTLVTHAMNEDQRRYGIERMQTHTMQLRGDRRPEVIPRGWQIRLTISSLRMAGRKGLREHYGFSNDDTDVLQMLIEYDWSDAISARGDPIAQAMCERLEAGDPDIVALAALLRDAYDVEPRVYEEVFDDLSRRMSREGIERFWDLASEEASGTTMSRTDFAAVAHDAPEYMREHLAHFCWRFWEGPPDLDPSELTPQPRRPSGPPPKDEGFRIETLEGKRERQ